MLKPHAAAAFALTLLFAWPTAIAGNEIRTQRVQFAPGSSGTSITGSLTGYDAVDYVLGARAGQRMSVSLRTDNTSNYFNILPPGADDEAIYVGSAAGNDYDGVLPADGDYKVRVYLMRNAARRDEVAAYTLDISITSGEGAGG